MFRRLYATDDGTATSILRLCWELSFRARCAEAVGLVRRLRVAGTMGFFTGMMHIPAPLAFLAIAAEFFGEWTHPGIPDSNRSVRHWCEHAGCNMTVHRGFGFS